jgi:hypothetical protein
MADVIDLDIQGGEALLHFEAAGEALWNELSGERLRKPQMTKV